MEYIDTDLSSEIISKCEEKFFYLSGILPDLSKDRIERIAGILIKDEINIEIKTFEKQIEVVNSFIGQINKKNDSHFNSGLKHAYEGRIKTYNEHINYLKNLKLCLFEHLISFN
jgi:hypothetical protein